MIKVKIYLIKRIKGTCQESPDPSVIDPSVIVLFVIFLQRTCEKSPDPSVIVDHVGTASSHRRRTEKSDKSAGPVYLSSNVDVIM